MTDTRRALTLSWLQAHRFVTTRNLSKTAGWLADTGIAPVPGGNPAVAQT